MGRPTSSRRFQLAQAAVGPGVRMSTHPSPDEVRALAERLNASAAEFERPPSVQSMANIRAINAMNEAASTLLALLERAEGAERERAEQWRIARDRDGDNDVLKAVNAELRDSLTLALEALKGLVHEANKLAPQLPYNAPTADLAAAIDKAWSILSTLSASLEKQEVSPSVDESAASLASELTGQDRPTSLEKLREAVEVFVSAYRKKYSNAFGRVRENAPMRAEVVKLNEAFWSPPPLSDGGEDPTQLPTEAKTNGE